MQFYVLGSPTDVDCTYDTDVYHMKPHVVGEAPRCPECGLLVGMLPWLPPYHAEIITRGRAFGDVAIGTGMDLLVSDSFRRAWLDAQLVGIEVFHPIERMRVRPARLKKHAPTYYLITPRLFDVQIDLEHSLVEYKQLTTCSKCKGGDTATVRGFSLDETTWHGEDMFLAWGISSEFIVSDRVRELRDKHGLTNVNLTPVEQYLWDPLKQWTPHCFYPPAWFEQSEHVPDESTVTN